MKKILIPLFTALLSAAALLGVSASPVSAAVPLVFQDDVTEYTFDNGNEDSNEWFFTGDDCVDITKTTISDNKVLSVTAKSGWIIVYPKTQGSAVVTATGEDGSTASIKFTVKKSFFERQLEDRTRFSDADACVYGSRKIEIFSVPGAKGTLTIGKDKYKVNFKKKNYVTIKLKKYYKVNTKAKLTLKLQGASITQKNKFLPAVSVYSIKASGKKLTLSCVNLTKGDTVKVTYKGKTYKASIKKSHRQKTFDVVIKVKNKVKKNASLKVVITNKYKQTLSSETYKLVNRQYIQPDDDVDDEYYEPENDEE